MADASAADTVRTLPPTARLSLRLRPTGALPDFLGLSLALDANRCRVHGDRILARLGPDEWLLVGPAAEADRMAAAIGAALAGRFHSLVDVSDRDVAFAVSGPHADAILNAGCPLDLHPSVFRPGSATRTLMGKAEIVLMRPGEEPVWHVACARSLSAYMHRFLAEAASVAEACDAR